VVTGVVDEHLMQTAARILLRYTKAEPGRDCAIKLLRDGGEELRQITNDCTETEIEGFRI
jgi:hypothetical protein